MIELTLKPGRDKQLRRGHPWVFSGALRDLDPQTPAGSPARFRAADGEILGTGYVNPRCAIAGRVVAAGAVELDRAFFEARVRRALELRTPLEQTATNVYRLINGEGDFLPGFVVDRFGDVLVLQCLTAGADRLRDLLVDALRNTLRPAALIDQSRGSVRKAEGLADRDEIVFGEVPEQMVLEENGLRVAAAPGRGQKTGYFCDQRDNRLLVHQSASGRRVLDAFCYSGGFAANAAAGGAARVVAVDSSRDALSLAERTLAANDGLAVHCELTRAKVADYLRATDETFDIAVLDPPPLVRRRNDLRHGLRAYRDLNLWAIRRLEEGGRLLTFTCSQHVDDEAFRRAVTDAAAAARRPARVLAKLGPGIDHPVAIAHGEGEYLRGLLIGV